MLTLVIQIHFLFSLRRRAPRWVEQWPCKRHWRRRSLQIRQHGQHPIVLLPMSEQCCSRNVTWLSYGDWNLSRDVNGIGQTHHHSISPRRYMAAAYRCFSGYGTQCDSTERGSKRPWDIYL